MIGSYGDSLEENLNGQADLPGAIGREEGMPSEGRTEPKINILIRVGTRYQRLMHHEVQRYYAKSSILVYQLKLGTDFHYFPSLL